MRRNFSQNLFIGIIVILTVLNTFNGLKYTVDRFKSLLTAHVFFPPGYPYLPLKPYLSNVKMAGFYTDWESPQPAIDPVTMGQFQSAQYVLSPTLLDYFHALNHEFIIFYCTKPETEEITVTKIGAIPLVRLANGILLLKKISK